MNDEPQPLVEKAQGRKLTFVAIGIFVSAVALMVYGPDFGVAWGGIGMLLGIPFAFGMLVGQTTDRDQTMGCFVWPTLSVIALLFVAYLIFGEGVICIAMIMPIWIAAAIGGALASILTHRRNSSQDDKPNENRLKLVAWTILPAFLVIAESPNRKLLSNTSML